jgi:hypothetical protein
MSHFRQSFEALAEGAVICSVTRPDLHAWITEKGMGELNAHLQPLGRRVGVSGAGGAYFLEWADDRESARAAVSQARTMVEEAERVDAFIALLLEIDDLDGEPAPGRLVRHSEIVAAVSGSAAIREMAAELAGLVGARDSTEAGRITRILDKMSAAGYLRCVSRDRGDYEITGKVELHYDVNAYLAETVGPIRDAVEEATQGALL